MIYANFGDFKDALKQDLTLKLFRNQNNEFSILTETQIIHDQMHHIRNNLLGPIFSCPGDLRLFLMTELSVFMLLQGITPGKSWLGEISFKDNKIIWEIKVR